MGRHFLFKPSTILSRTLFVLCVALRCELSAQTRDNSSNREIERWRAKFAAFTLIIIIIIIFIALHEKKIIIQRFF